MSKRTYYVNIKTERVSCYKLTGDEIRKIRGTTRTGARETVMVPIRRARIEAEGRAKLARIYAREERRRQRTIRSIASTGMGFAFLETFGADIAVAIRGTT